MTDPYIQLIDSICDEVLPNMVRIYESRKLESVLDYQHFISLIERKVEQANKALSHLDPARQPAYRGKINAAYATTIDRLLQEMEEDLRATAWKLGERVKELRCLYTISGLLNRDDLSPEQILGEVAAILPSGMQVPENSGARIRMGDREWTSPGFSDTPWKISEEIPCEERPIGSVDISRLSDISGGERALFLDEERQLLREVALRLAEARRRRRANEDRSRLASIVECADEAIIGKDLDGLILSWNRAAERVYGYSAGEVIGKPIAILLAPGQPDDTRSILERLRRGDRLENYEATRMRKDGRVIQVSLTISPIRGPGGRIAGISTIARDITREKEVQNTLLEQVHFVRELLDRIPMPVYVRDKSGMYLGVNRAFEEFSGRSRTELMGHRAHEVWPADMAAHYDAIALQVISSGQIHVEEYILPRSGGPDRRGIFTRAPFYGMDGEIRGIVATIQDITYEDRRVT